MADIEKLVANISDLPTLPDVVSKINRLVTDKNTSAGDISKVIESDVALSAKILKLVNSPFYGFPKRITTITYAVVILGFRAVRNLALSAFVFDAFKGKAIASFDIKDFWRHSICTAMLAGNLAKKFKPELAEDAFMAGLLHDLGKAIMCQYLPEDVEAAARLAREKGCLFIEAEKELHAYDHTQLGGLLLEKWNVPDALITASRHHHRPSLASTPRLVCSLVHLSDILARTLNLGSGGDDLVPALEPEAWEELGLTWDAIGEEMDQMLQQSGKADAFFAMA